MRLLGACLLGGLCVLAGSPTDAATQPPDPELRFSRAGEAPRALTLAQLRERCGSARVEVADPYYERPKRFHGLPLACALAQGFGSAPDALRSQAFLLRALDGYTRPASGGTLLEPGGYLAFADADLVAEAAGAPAWEPIARRKLEPGPFYLVWAGPGQGDPHAYPWPYQLAHIEWAGFEATHPRTVPRGLPTDDPGWRGYALYQRDCAACHAINGQGGTVGPELNVPRSIVEYRPPAQLREFIRDPGAFRHTSMPANPQLDASDLDALLAYFRAMAARKHDPRP